jgi:hypothetical protein
MPDYWQAVARGIDAEDQKATIFVAQNDSLGVAREAILRDLLVKQTPEPYRVSTGFIYLPNPEPWSSKQCDVLVYDPTVSQPYYAIGGFSVVPRRAAKLVIEVKTNLELETFRETLDVWKTTYWLPIPTLGFAYEGVTFKTFLTYVGGALKDDEQGIPECIAVHRQNYLVVRSPYRLAPDQAAPRRHRPAKYHLAVDFTAAGGREGQASAAFLDFYHRLLRNDLYESYLPTWFNELGLPDEALVRITDDGNMSYGPIP